MQKITAQLLASLPLFTVLSACGPHYNEDNAPATALNTVTGYPFDPTRDGLPYKNFSDLVMSGYCVGETTVHAFLGLDPKTREKVLGPKVAKWFESNPAVNEESAVRLMRLFALLQLQKPWKEYIQTKLKTEIKSAAEMKSYFDYLQKSPGREQGLLAFIRRVDNPTGNWHHVYFYGAAEDRGDYFFSYLDPNIPQRARIMRYDPASNQTFFKDDREVENPNYFKLINFSTVDETLQLVKNSLADLQKNPGNSDLITFLKFKDDKGGKESKRPSDHEKLKARLQQINKMGLPSREEVALMGIQSPVYRQLIITGQIELDKGCESFRKFHELASQTSAEMKVLVEEQIGRWIAAENYTQNVLSDPQKIDALLIPKFSKKQLHCLSQLFTI